MPQSEEFVVKKSDSWRMFNDISPRYDLLNRLLSLGLDVHWRHCLLKYLPEKSNLRVLDLATGTADVLLTIVDKRPDVKQCVGLDPAERMLDVGRRKIEARNLADKIRLETADAHRIPYSDRSFDLVTISFGIRNMTDPQKVLKNMNRVLSVGGRALILEFSLPGNPVIRFFHLGYLRVIVPAIGGLFTGHYKAYKYLNQTIEDFPYGDNFCAWMKDAGFANVRANPLLWGVATIYQGDKAA